MIDLVANKLGRGQRLTPAEQKDWDNFVAAAQRSVARTLATDTGGASRSANYRRLVVDGDLYVPAGVIKVGPDKTGNVTINTGGIKLNYGATNKIWLQTDGDVLIGDDTSSAAKTYISIFSTGQTYNGEVVSAGDMLIGDNSASKANIFWDKSAGQLLFRGGTSTQAYIDTSGALTAGAGQVLLDASGITLVPSATLVTQAQIKWISGATTYLEIGADTAGNTRYRVPNTSTLSFSVQSGKSISVSSSLISLNGNTRVDTGDLTVDQQLKVPTTGSSAGILIGGDAQWYRSAADTLRTPDSVVIDGSLTVSSNSGNVLSGTYTPTVTNGTNIAANTPQVARYERVGNTVTVSGYIDIDPTAGGGTVSDLRLSLPIASNFSGVTQCSGTFSDGNNNNGRIVSVAATDDAQFIFNSNTTANTSFSYIFQYQVI